MDEDRLRAILDGVVPLVYKDETGSTNDDAKVLAAEGLAPVLVVAGRQTAGRGRRGNTFLSPEGGIYMSLIVPAPLDSLELLTSFIGVCVCKALEETCGLRVGIKWVNDIYVGGKKLAGILVEHVSDKVVVGIGVNGLVTPGCGLQAIATSLAEYIGSPDCEKICAVIADKTLLGLHHGIDAETTLEYCRQRSVLLGHEVCYFVAGVERRGVAVDVTQEGKLAIRTDDGIVRLGSAAHDVRLCGCQKDSWIVSR